VGSGEWGWPMVEEWEQRWRNVLQIRRWKIKFKDTFELSFLLVGGYAA